MILSHRGYWLKESEKNTIESFERSFSLGFGTETDLRDFKGEVVISHDIPLELGITFDKFLELYLSFDKTLPLALNIKADGLQEIIVQKLQKHKIENYFVFDMSIPDTIGYINKKVNFFSRQSEYEINPSFYENCSGLWLDEFFDHWITKEIIEKHLRKEKSVCIVSPELHGREYRKEWIDYRNNFDILHSTNVSICTDKPEEAKKFFT